MPLECRRRLAVDTEVEPWGGNVIGVPLLLQGLIAGLGALAGGAPGFDGRRKAAR